MLVAQTLQKNITGRQKTRVILKRLNRVLLNLHPASLQKLPDAQAAEKAHSFICAPVF